MTTLHRCPTPTDWLCPCGRVARALRRAGIAYEEVRVPYRRAHRQQVLELTGQARVPVLELDGEAVCDSHRIVELLAWRAGATHALQE
ncbi:glutathione S-transferase N-terminal domain-containing protein [Conexibacter stalactiti]|uniref:Glutathione S-transferase N-terminal domain-containing protein n=1 Tax=Conexibacter stalactiti TaxID=1940611 RepID=A0ABU4HPA1_9ACTN|nr:glutathione S-transferase N-terminal domain-containing protein [Conexibacter stalactiti]MDW5594380.1 glutathione S-transferase N-terminal domain-containing protein [Conexibacter stalactiti]MEC5035022.1 glutathione S-transferase N-terminal domain-containing protein [Conexibacter stalactiti]